MRSQRQLRVGEEIRHALAAVLQRDEFRWPEGMEPAIVTVTEVQVSPDLKNATVFVMPLGGARIKEIVAALNHAASFFRHVVAEEVKLRAVPRLSFAPDTSFEYAHKIDALLHKPEVSRDLEEKE